jgi:hypothetical protein
MASIPGVIGFLQTGAFTRVRTIQRAVAIGGGPRLPVIMGEGIREELVVDSALGNGLDGVSADFIGFQNKDGRHFLVSTFPIVTNRFNLFLNGTQLEGEEGTIADGYDGGPIPDEFDYRVDLSNGRIIMQNATLENFGTDAAPVHFQAGENNRGTGFLSAPVRDAYGVVISYTSNQVNLLDEEAPAEVWTLRAISSAQVSNSDSTLFTPATIIAALSSNSGPGYIQLDHRNQVLASVTVSISGGLPIPLTSFASDVDGFPITLNTATGRITIDSAVVTADVSGTSYEFFYDYIDVITSFSLTGSISGLSRNPVTNAPIIWLSDGTENDNGILEFAVNETLGSGAVDFALNDVFFIQVNSRKLNPRDRLEARYIAEPDINDVQLFDDPDILYQKHGAPSTSNTLSLGAQMAFENGAPAVYAIQPKPPIARRTAETLLTSRATPDGVGATGGSAASDLTFEITTGQPDGDTNVNIFVISDTNPNNSNQIFPAKIGFYNPDYGDDAASLAAGHAAFVSDNPLSAYTIIERFDVVANKNRTYLFLSPDLFLANGQGLRITYIDERDADFFDAGWANAFSELEKYDPYYVVPLPECSISLVQRNAVEHAKKMSDTRHRKERIVITGTPRGVTVDALLGLELVAYEDVGLIEGVQGDELAELAANNNEDLQDLSVERNYGNTFRMIWLWPDELIRIVNGERVALSGIYLAAAAAGRLSRRSNLAEPLTRRDLSGFTILRDKIISDFLMDQLGDAGVSVVVPITGGGRVRFGLTTIQNGVPEEEEPSVIDIRDFVAKVSREGLEERFVGTPFDRTTIGSIQTVTTNILTALVSQGLITQFAELSVKRDSVEPRQVNVRFAVEPVFPVNWIFIDISVGVL